MRKLLFLIFSLLLEAYMAHGQTFQWVNTLGGAKATTLPANVGNATTSSCIDHEGNIIVVGHYSDTADFDPGPGKTILTIYDTNGYRQNLFYAKYSPNGHLIWAKTMYGTGLSRANAVAVDKEGNIFFGGLAEGGISPDTGVIGPGNPLLSDEGFGGSYQGFLVKVNSMGNFMAGRRFGGRSTEVKAISVGEDGSIYITGQYVLASRFNYGLGNDTLGDIGDPVFKGNFYFARFGNDLSFRWVKGIGNKTYNQCNAIMVNADKSFFLAGGGRDTLDFDPGAASFFINPPGTNGALNYGFFAKYDSLGRFLFVRPLLGGGVVNTLQKDRFKNIYLGGSGPQSMDFDPGPDSAFLMQWFSGFFIAKYDSVTNLKWGFGMGGNGNLDVLNNIYIDSSGSANCTGQFTGVVDFDPGSPLVMLSSMGYQNQITATDAFLSKISSQGNLMWARRMGSLGSDVGNVVVQDRNAKIYSAGSFIGTVDFDLLSGVQNKTSLNASDAYLVKYSQCITRTQIRDTICFGGTKTFDGETLTKSGKYIRLKSYNPANQCEVWEELFLHVRPEIPASAGADVSVCSGKSQQLGSDSLSGLSYQWQQLGGTLTSTQATPIRSYTNFSDSVQRYRFALRVTDAKGCQKRDTITLSIAPVLRDTLVKAICPGENFLGYDTAGTYTDTLVSSLGCDSIRTLALSIKPNRTFSQSIRLCKNQNLQVGTRIYTQPGIYLDTLTAFNGCDSLITSTLNYDIPNDTILLNGLNFTAADNQDSYQWLDCNQNFQAIAGATQQSFTPISNGSYAVKTTKGNCADTSNCALFTSGKDLLTSQIRIYPQPVKDKLYIDMPETGQTTELVLLDALGRIVFKEKDRNISSISVSKLPAGLYQLKIFQGNQIEVFGVMVER